MKLQLIVLVALSLAGCAEVPTQSVELSALLGKDMKQMQRAHLKLVDLYYDRVESDANRFVDGVYAPYQLNAVLEHAPQFVGATDKVASPAGMVKDRQIAVDFLKVSLVEVRNNIEDFRKRNLAPIREQRRQLAASITDSYENMERSNGAITGYLASLVKLKRAQDDLLKTNAAPEPRTDISRSLADVAERIDTLNQDASKSTANGQNDLNGIVRQFEMLMQAGSQP